MTREYAIGLLIAIMGHEPYGSSVSTALDMAISALREQDATDINVGNKTNADHIRSMTDEELAKLFEEVGYDSMEHRSTYWLNWLKQPYKEDA